MNDIFTTKDTQQHNACKLASMLHGRELNAEFFFTKHLSELACKQPTSQLVANTLKMSDFHNSLLLNMLCLNRLFFFLFLPLLSG